MSEGFSNETVAVWGLLSAAVMRAYESRFTIQSESASLSSKLKLYARSISCLLVKFSNR